MLSAYRLWMSCPETRTLPPPPIFISPQPKPNRPPSSSQDSFRDQHKQWVPPNDVWHAKECDSSSSNNSRSAFNTTTTRTNFTFAEEYYKKHFLFSSPYTGRKYGAGSVTFSRRRHHAHPNGRIESRNALIHEFSKPSNFPIVSFTMLFER